MVEIFQYLFLLIFSNRSMYMNMLTGRNTPSFAKDTVYRFMKMIQINWIRFTTLLSARIIKETIVPLNSENRVNVLIIDDSLFERNRSKKGELLAKIYDHAKPKVSIRISNAYFRLVRWVHFLTNKQRSSFHGK